MCHVYLSTQQMSAASLCLSSHAQAHGVEDMRALLCHSTAGRAKLADFSGWCLHIGSEPQASCYLFQNAPESTIDVIVVVYQREGLANGLQRQKTADGTHVHRLYSSSLCSVMSYDTFLRSWAFTLAW